ncbi:SCP-like protein [Ostertagia ostertagi]
MLHKVKANESLLALIGCDSNYFLKTWDCDLESLANEAVTNCPTAATLNPTVRQALRIEYLLSLEKVAQEQAEKWAAATADAPPPLAGPAEWNWMNLAVFNATAAEDELKATEKAVRSWWDLRNKIDQDVMNALMDNRNVTTPATEFVELTRGNYTHVGCAVAGGEFNYNVVCAYKLR